MLTIAHKTVEMNITICFCHLVPPLSVFCGLRLNAFENGPYFQNAFAMNKLERDGDHLLL